jgi:hypothetical protein
MREWSRSCKVRWIGQCGTRVSRMGLLFTRSASAKECKDAEDIPLNPGILKLIRWELLRVGVLSAKVVEEEFRPNKLQEVVSKGRFYLKADLDHETRQYQGGAYNLGVTTTDSVVSC